MNDSALFGRYEDGPSVCAPSPKVMKNIKKELIAARAVSAHETRLASMMGLAPAGTSNSIGFNDGVIYPPGEGPEFAPKRGLSLTRSASLAPLATRKLHALALLGHHPPAQGGVAPTARAPVRLLGGAGAAAARPGPHGRPAPRRVPGRGPGAVALRGRDQVGAACFPAGVRSP